MWDTGKRNPTRGRRRAIVEEHGPSSQRVWGIVQGGTVPLQAQQNGAQTNAFAPCPTKMTLDLRPDSNGEADFTQI